MTNPTQPIIIEIEATLDAIIGHHACGADETTETCKIRKATSLINQYIESEVVKANMELLKRLQGKVTEIHLTDLEMKEHHTGVSWEDVLHANVLIEEMLELTRKG